MTQDFDFTEKDETLTQRSEILINAIDQKTKPAEVYAKLVLYIIQYIPTESSRKSSLKYVIVRLLWFKSSWYKG